MSRLSFIRLLIIINTLLAGAFDAMAQQAIINLPSADITPRGQVFLMHETQTRSWNPGRYWYGTNFLTVGVGRGTELALTTYNHGGPAAPNGAVGVGFKTGIRLFEEALAKEEVQLTVGQMLIISTTGRGIGNFSYGHGSFRLPRAGTRITAGISGGTDELFKKDTVHFIGAVEHKLGKKWMLTAEWFSGRHDFGFLTPGVLYHPTPQTVIVVGYKIPNHAANGKAGFVFEFGIFLGQKKKD